MYKRQLEDCHIHDQADRYRFNTNEKGKAKTIRTVSYSGIKAFDAAAAHAHAVLISAV